MVYFTKMQGLGNDFIVIDNTQGNVCLSCEEIRDLADRKFGVGFDQLLMVEPAISAGVDFQYTIFNSDGSEVSQCGNGARCFARYVVEKDLINSRKIIVETRAGIMTLEVNPDNTIKVNMGAPIFEPSVVPISAQELTKEYSVEGFSMGVLSMGNPHAIIISDSFNDSDIESIGTKIQSADFFPESANVGFMSVVNRGEINLRVYERGVGETLACGSGAAAAVVHGQQMGLLDDTVTVHLLGGDALIEHHPDGDVFLSGPAEFVFEGAIKLRSDNF
ncbi:MAG: diaminopimelate epimerase [Gammaproteobacteria bacterium]|nr:diaminopimelate epimerase [Gammaproteobacteria bacterium]